MKRRTLDLQKLINYRFLLPATKIAQYGDAVMRLEKRIALRFGGCSRAEGSAMHGLWVTPHTGYLVSDVSEIRIVALTSLPRDFRDLVAALAQSACELHEEAIFLFTASNAWIVPAQSKAGQRSAYALKHHQSSRKEHS